MIGEVYSYIIPGLMALGAKDVFLTDIQMKKNRPGILLSVLVDEGVMASATSYIFKETTTFGIRKRVFERMALNRNFVMVDTPYGTINMKEGVLDGEVIKASPEYNDCERAAMDHQVAMREVYQAALQEYRNMNR